MIKSVKIKDKYGVLVKIIYRKSGIYEMLKRPTLPSDIKVEVRDDKNCKVLFGGGE